MSYGPGSLALAHKPNEYVPHADIVRCQRVLIALADNTLWGAMLTLVQYLWFRFMDTGLFMNQLQTNYQIVAQAYQLTAGESKALLDAVSMMKPIAWASMFMMTDLVAGAVLSPIIAAVMAKKDKQQHTK